MPRAWEPRAIRAAPVRSRRRCGSSLASPSGKIPIAPPRRRWSKHAANVCTLPAVPAAPSTSCARWIGSAPAKERSARSTGFLKSVPIARKLIGRGITATRSAGSTKPPWWLATRSTGPVRGIRSSPVTSTARNHPFVASLAISRTSRSASRRMAGMVAPRAPLRCAHVEERPSRSTLRAPRAGGVHGRVDAGATPSGRVPGAARAHQRTRRPGCDRPTRDDGRVRRARRIHRGLRSDARATARAAGGRRPRVDRSRGPRDGRGRPVPPRPPLQLPSTRGAGGSIVGERRARPRSRDRWRRGHARLGGARAGAGTGPGAP